MMHHFQPRQLLTSGTAVAAVAGALLLGAEDVGLAQFTRAHTLGIDGGVAWTSAPAARRGQTRPGLAAHGPDRSSSPR